MIILGIWNDALVFIVGAGTGWSSSIIIGFWGVYIGVGVWSSSIVRSSFTTAGEVSSCIGCRCGKHFLGHCFSVCPIYFVFYMDCNTMYQLLYGCLILMGVDSDGLCVIPSNVTTWRASCVIILGIWNVALVCIVGAGRGWPSSIIIGFWGICVGVGVWSSSTVRSSSTTTGEVSACMGCRCGERLLGHDHSWYME